MAVDIASGTYQNIYFVNNDYLSVYFNGSNFTITNKVDALVNGVQKSAGTSTQFSYSSIDVTVQFTIT